MREETYTFWQTKGKKMVFSFLGSYKAWIWTIVVTVTLLLALIIFGTYLFYKKLFETLSLISWDPFLVGITVLLIVSSAYGKKIREIWGIRVGRIRWLILLLSVTWLIFNVNLSAGLFYWIAVTLLSAVFKSLIKLLDSRL